MFIWNQFPFRVDAVKIDERNLIQRALNDYFSAALQWSNQWDVFRSFDFYFACHSNLQMCLQAFIVSFRRVLLTVSSFFHLQRKWAQFNQSVHAFALFFVKMHMFWSEDFQRLSHFTSEKGVSGAMLHDAKFWKMEYQDATKNPSEVLADGELRIQAAN